MRSHPSLSIPRLVTWALGCAAVGYASATVTLVNHSGRDLLVACAGGQGQAPVLITALTRESQGVFRAFVPEPVSSSPALPDRPPQRHYRFQDGDAVSFTCEEPGQDLESEQRLYRVDDPAGFDFHGIAVFTPSAPPAEPGSQPEPPLRLSLAPDRSRSPQPDPPAEPTILVAYQREFEVLPRSGLAAPGQPDQPLD